MSSILGKKTSCIPTTKCGSCEGLNRTKLFPELCRNRGKKEFSKACKKFSPKADVLASVPTNILIELGQVLKTLTPEQGNILGLALQGVSALKKRSGYRFGQRVYVSVSLNNVSKVYKAYVIGYNKLNKTITLTAKLGEKSTVIQVLKESILSKKEATRKISSGLKKIPDKVSPLIPTLPKATKKAKK